MFFLLNFQITDLWMITLYKFFVLCIKKNCIISSLHSHASNAPEIKELVDLCKTVRISKQWIELFCIEFFRGIALHVEVKNSMTISFLKYKNAKTLTKVKLEKILIYVK